MNRISAIGGQTQITFGAKPGNRKAVHEFIDRTNDLAMELLNKDRPLDEKREKLIRDTLLKLKIKCPYVGIIAEKGKATVEHIKQFLK